MLDTHTGREHRERPTSAQCITPGGHAGCADVLWVAAHENLNELNRHRDEG